MLGTVVSILLAGYLLLTGVEIPPATNFHWLSAIFFFTSVFLSALLPYLYANAWGAVQRAELKATPRVTELFYSDRFLFLARLWCIFFPLAVLFLALDLTVFGIIKKPVVLGLLIVLFGITLDVIYQAFKVMSDFLSPTLVLKRFSSAAKDSIKEERYGDFCAWIDAISEVGLHAVHSMRLSLCMQSLDDLQEALRHFLNASKSISHRLPNVTEEGKGQTTDTVPYVLLFAFQRLEMIDNAAAKMKLEPVCSYIINVLGKISLDAAQYDITVAQYPLLFMGRLTKLALENELPEVASKATSALMALGKTLPNKVDLTYLEIAPFYTGIVSQLDENARAIFRNDKNVNISILLQPFTDIKALFDKGKLESHQDAPAIRSAVDNVVSQYKTLEDVMKSMMPFGPEGGGMPAAPMDDDGLSAKIVDDLEQRLRQPPKTEAGSGGSESESL